MAEQEVALETQWPEEYPVEAANVFKVSRVMDEVEFLYGYMPLSAVTDRLARGERTLKVEVAKVRSLSLSARAFQDLHAKVTEIYDAMLQAGVYSVGGDNASNND